MRFACTSRIFSQTHRTVLTKNFVKNNILHFKIKFASSKFNTKFFSKLNMQFVKYFMLTAFSFSQYFYL